MFKLRITTLFLFISVLAATSVSAMTLPRGQWQLSSYNFMDKVAYPIDESEVTININANGKLGGHSGCNVYGGSYSVSNGKLKIGDLISTMMACEEPSMQFEQLFTQTLQNAEKFSVKDGLLTITDQKTHNFLRFKRVLHPNK